MRPAFYQRGTVNPDKNRPEYIVIHHTAISSLKYDRQLEIVKGYDMRRWGQLAYHYMVGRDGTIAPMLDESVSGTHTWCKKIHNFRQCIGNPNWMDEHSLGVVLAGDFRSDKLSTAQFASFRELVGRLQKKYKINDDKVILHSDAQNTTCPAQDFRPSNWKNLQTLY